MQHHGRYVSSITCHSFESADPWAQLPCARLVSLDLSGVQQPLAGQLRAFARLRRLGPSNDLPGVFAGCASLTRLQLTFCQVPNNSDLLNVSVLVQLQELQLHHIALPPVPGEPFSYAVFPGTLLPSLGRLTCLRLSFVRAQDLHHVSALSSLAVLSLSSLVREEERGGRAYRTWGLGPSGIARHGFGGCACGSGSCCVAGSFPIDQPSAQHSDSQG